MFPSRGALLALTGALAAACFVKAFGITFLALPRSEKAAQAHEAALSMRAGMGILAGGVRGAGAGRDLVSAGLRSHHASSSSAPA